MRWEAPELPVQQRRVTALGGSQARRGQLLGGVDHPLTQCRGFGPLPVAGDVRAVRMVVDAPAPAHADEAVGWDIEGHETAPVARARWPALRAVLRLVQGASLERVGLFFSHGSTIDRDSPSRPCPCLREPRARRRDRSVMAIVWS